MIKVEVAKSVYTFRRGHWRGGRAETRRLLKLATETARSLRPSGSYEPDEEFETLRFLRKSGLKFRLISDVPENYETDDPNLVYSPLSPFK